MSKPSIVWRVKGHKNLGSLVVRYFSNEVDAATYADQVEGILDYFRPKADAWLDGRPVRIEGFEGNGIDSFVTAASFMDFGEEELTEEELTELDADDWLVEANIERYGYWRD